MRLRLHVVLALAAGALLLLQLQRRVLSGSSPPALQQPGLPPAPRRHAPQRAFAPSVHTAPPTDALEQEAPSEPSEPRASAASLSVPPPVAAPARSRPRASNVLPDAPAANATSIMCHHRQPRWRRRRHPHLRCRSSPLRSAPSCALRRRCRLR